VIPREPPRVLIATHSLTGFSGTDLYTRDLGLALLRSGWLPVIYSKLTGRIADELRSATIPVLTDLDGVTAPPHIIHGHHNLETLATLARFPTVPAIFVCHDALAWHSLPPLSPRIGAYVAVDRNCRDRMLLEHRIPEDSIRILMNAVELHRFRQRSALPANPRRALVFSNQAREQAWVSPIRSACQRRGIALDVAGIGSGHFTERPEDLLPEYDLVFGKARCALEALATGAAVIVCDAAGLAGMVTTNNVDDLRQLNFGARTLTRPITTETIEQELARYDPRDARAVSDKIQAVAGVDLLAAEFISLYEDVRSRQVPVAPDAEFLATARSLDRVMAALYGGASSRRSIVTRVARRLVNSKWFSVAARLMNRVTRGVGR
jgi:hypothetical protein